MGNAEDHLSELREWWEKPRTMTFTARYTPGKGWSVTAEVDVQPGLVFAERVAEIIVREALDDEMPYGPDVQDHIIEENMGEDA